MRPRNWWNVEKVVDLKSRWAQVTGFLNDVYSILTGGLVWQDNMRGAFIEFNFTSANVEFTIKHGLSFVPKYYIIVINSGDIVVYSNRSFDKTNIYLKATNTGIVSLFVF